MIVVGNSVGRHSLKRDVEVFEDHVKGRRLVYHDVIELDLKKAEDVEEYIVGRVHIATGHLFKSDDKILVNVVSIHPKSLFETEVIVPITRTTTAT
jgi:hypothetical protein